jgi:hypothetical protein
VITCFLWHSVQIYRKILLFDDTKRQGNEERTVRNYEGLQFDTYRTQIYNERA